MAASSGTAACSTRPRERPGADCHHDTPSTSWPLWTPSQNVDLAVASSGRSTIAARYLGGCRDFDQQRLATHDICSSNPVAPTTCSGGAKALLHFAAASHTTNVSKSLTRTGGSVSRPQPHEQCNQVIAPNHQIDAPTNTLEMATRQTPAPPRDRARIQVTVNRCFRV